MNGVIFKYNKTGTGVNLVSLEDVSYEGMLEKLQLPAEVDMASMVKEYLQDQGKKTHKFLYVLNDTNILITLLKNCPLLLKFCLKFLKLNLKIYFNLPPFGRYKVNFRPIFLSPPFSDNRRNRRFDGDYGDDKISATITDDENSDGICLHLVEHLIFYQM